MESVKSPSGLYLFPISTCSISFITINAIVMPFKLSSGERHILKEMSENVDRFSEARQIILPFAGKFFQRNFFPNLAIK